MLLSMCKEYMKRYCMDDNASNKKGMKNNATKQVTQSNGLSSTWADKLAK